jgi:hypothetical protein
MVRMMSVSLTKHLADRILFILSPAVSMIHSFVLARFGMQSFVGAAEKYICRAHLS